MSDDNDDSAMAVSLGNDLSVGLPHDGKVALDIFGEHFKDLGQLRQHIEQYEESQREELCREVYDRLTEMVEQVHDQVGLWYEQSVGIRQGYLKHESDQQARQNLSRCMPDGEQYARARQKKLESLRGIEKYWPGKTQGSLVMSNTSQNRLEQIAKMSQMKAPGGVAVTFEIAQRCVNRATLSRVVLKNSQRLPDLRATHADLLLAYELKDFNNYTSNELRLMELAGILIVHDGGLSWAVDGEASYLNRAETVPPSNYDSDDSILTKALSKWNSGRGLTPAGANAYRRVQELKTSPAGSEKTAVPSIELQHNLAMPSGGTDLDSTPTPIRFGGNGIEGVVLSFPDFRTVARSAVSNARGTAIAPDQSSAEVEGARRPDLSAPSTTGMTSGVRPSGSTGRRDVDHTSQGSPTSLSMRIPKGDAEGGVDHTATTSVSMRGPKGNADRGVEHATGSGSRSRSERASESDAENGVEHTTEGDARNGSGRDSQQTTQSLPPSPLADQADTARTRQSERLKNAAAVGPASAGQSHSGATRASAITEKRPEKKPSKKRAQNREGAGRSDDCDCNILAVSTLI